MPKGIKGTGYKRQRGKSYQIQVYKPDGSRVYETINGEQKANKRISALQTDIDRREHIDPVKMSFYDFCTQKYLPAAKFDLESGTYKDYKGYINNHIKKHYVSKMKLSEIELTHLEDFKIWLFSVPRADKKPGTLSSKTIKNIIICLQAIFTYACRTKVLKFSPAEYLTFPKITKYKPVTWNEEQAKHFLDVAFWDRFYFLILLDIFYSKRKGEIRGLRKQDIDLKALTASIRQSVRGSGYNAEYKNLKDEDSEHVLELELWMVPFFEREFAERAKEKLLFGPGYNDNDLVFASYNGNPVKERTLDEHFSKIIERAGVPKIRFHDLRHTCITIMLKRGWSLKHAQERAHHADIRTTGNIYSHITPEMNRDVNQDLTKALGLKVSGQVLELRPLDKINNAKRTKKASQK